MSIDEIRDCSEYQVFLRGEEYYREGLVREIHYHRSKNTVTSEVKGARDRNPFQTKAKPDPGHSWFLVMLTRLAEKAPE